MKIEMSKVLSIAGMFHDIGKFAERAYALDPGDPDRIQQDYRYGHAYNTEQALLGLFSNERLEMKLAGFDTCTLLNLAARHHAPRTDYELIIAEADRIASGHERVKGDEVSVYDTGGREKKSKTPLISILSRIRLRDYRKKELTDWRYKINRASVAYGKRYKDIFPVKKNNYQNVEVQRDYQRHWEEFCSCIKKVGDFGLDIFDHFPTLFELCREFQWCLPATTRREDLSDSSLFDHQKATAGLAACLYGFHAGQIDLDGDMLRNESAITDRNEKKIILFCGDISGIQKFIYQISSKGAYRTLKGKSFFIQLLAEILAGKYIRRFNLTEANILYASGGKFYLLIPNSDDVQNGITILTDQINQSLFSDYQGTLFIRTGFIEMSGNDLTGRTENSLYQSWDELTRKLVSTDRNRYSNMAIDNYEKFFGINYRDKHASCPICHTTVKNSDDTVCRSCNDMTEIGRLLPKTNYIFSSENENAISQRYHLHIQDRFLWFLGKPPESVRGADIIAMAFNSKTFHKIPKQYSFPSIVNAISFLTGSTQQFECETFEEIAQKSKGIKRLGILRMDVDNLGKTFSEGLEYFKHEKIDKTDRFHSLGRITTLSWQLSLFFSAVLPSLIRQRESWSDSATVVYSGGDDLFLLGAWDRLPNIALTIKDEFIQFCCNNPSFSLSGGMVVTGGKFPIYKSADMAGEAEKKAKDNWTHFTSSLKPVKKNSFNFFDTSMHWREFKELSEIQKAIVTILEKKRNYPLLMRMRDISASWEESRVRLNRDRGIIDMAGFDMHLMAEKWRWRMVYALSRFCEDKGRGARSSVQQLKKMLVMPVAGTNRMGISLLGVLTRWCEFEIRGGDKEA